MKDASCVKSSLLAFTCSAEHQKGLGVTLTLLIQNFLSHTLGGKLELSQSLTFGFLWLLW